MEAFSASELTQKMPNILFNLADGAVDKAFNDYLDEVSVLLQNEVRGRKIRCLAPRKNHVV